MTKTEIPEWFRWCECVWSLTGDEATATPTAGVVHISVDECPTKPHPRWFRVQTTQDPPTEGTAK